MIAGKEAERLHDAHLRPPKAPWLFWGPYLSERQWGTVREDYSPFGNAWDYLPHDHARSRAYRWGEDGLAGISDHQARLCFALALWNGHDAIIKERAFGLTNDEGNHGEDVKEYYYYLDNTPTHSYMKWLYKYPQAAFPYAALVDENRRRKNTDSHAFEYELHDTGVFAENRYFDVQVEYAKASAMDILIRISVTNRGPDAAPLHVLPTLWFRNTWSWFPHAPRPKLQGRSGAGIARIDATCAPGDDAVPPTTLYALGADALLFVENESNGKRLWNSEGGTPFPKDGINDYLISQAATVNPALTGTKAAAQYTLHIAAGETQVLKLRLSSDVDLAVPFGAGFEETFATRLAEADEFYAAVGPASLTDEERAIQRQAYAGMLWSKQYYYYVVKDWLKGDPVGPPPPSSRDRNRDWTHFYSANILSMPDTWEYPWFAAWDLCFQAVVFARIDPEFAKQQLISLAHEWFMSPDGAVPAYEWSFSDVNPPLHAWAALRVFEIEKEMLGNGGDLKFLETILRYCLVYFTWWTNRKDSDNRNLYQGGFLGLDNISILNRSALGDFSGQIGRQVELYQSDGTSWMGMFSLKLMEIALLLAEAVSPEYDRLASRFFQHFLFIADAMNSIEQRSRGQVALWDDDDGFYYDALKISGNGRADEYFSIRLRSLTGIIALFPAALLDLSRLEPASANALDDRIAWFERQFPELVAQSRTDKGEVHLLSFVDPQELRAVLRRVLDESEFLSPYGIRGISAVYRDEPYSLTVDGVTLTERYEPAESADGSFGGNSNWRGPVWFPVNFLLIDTLLLYHRFFGEEFTVEYPTGSGEQHTLHDVAADLGQRLTSIFKRGPDGRRPVYGGTTVQQEDPHWRDLILFHEYFHGDNGAGLGASHQTGWTGLVAELLRGV